MNKKELEVNIIKKTDEIVNTVINSSNLENRKIKYEEAIEKVKDLSKLTVKFIGREEHLENMLKQLISQKLPDKKILDSFGDFSKDINYIIDCGVKGYKLDTSDKKIQNHLNKAAPLNIYVTRLYYKKGKKSKNEKEEIIENVSPVLKVLNNIFPYEKIISDYRVVGTKINYFLPQKQLAVIINNNIKKKNRILLNYWCNQNNIKLIELLSDEINNIKVIKKKLIHKI